MTSIECFVFFGFCFDFKNLEMKVLSGMLM